MNFVNIERLRAVNKQRKTKGMKQK